MYRRLYFFLIVFFALQLAPTINAQQAELNPPKAKKLPLKTEIHNDVRIDNYAWIKDRKDPDVLKLLEEENAYTESKMSHTKEFQENLYQEMVGRIKETDLDVPYRSGNYFYYTRTEKGLQYPIYCRKKENLDAEEEIILNLNEIAKSYKYLRLGGMSISPNHRLMAFSIDTTGSEEFGLLIKDLDSSVFHTDRIDNVVSIVWALDSKTLFYTTRDAAKRPYKLFRHTLGTLAKDDVLIYEERDELFRVFAYRTLSDRYIMLVTSASTSDEIRYLPADQPFGSFKMISAREPDHEYSVDHRGDQFYIVTNKGAKNFKLMSAPVNNPGQKNWKEVLPHRKGVTIENITCFKNHYLLFERELGIPKIRVTNFLTDVFHYIEFPEPVYSVFSSANRVFDTNVFRLNYQSLVTPSSIYDYDLNSRLRVLLKRTEVLGGYDPTQYVSERIYAKAPDGTDVPLSLVYRKGVTLDGRAPLHLTGYGSYGSPMSVGFSSNRLSLVDRGVIFALAHIRGGGDMGKEWHDDGKMLKKKNTFTDFIACAEHLLQEKYTSLGKLTTEGGSAGGLLMGAVTNLRPDLFKAVVAQVPFVDVINTMLDASLPLTVGEYLEWGNPNEEEYYMYMKSYCPYSNVEKKEYPNILTKVGLNDPRVGYWEGTKWVAKLRDLKTDTNTILLKANLGTGHGGASGRYDRLREIAFDYAYILNQHGILK